MQELTLSQFFEEWVAVGGKVTGVERFIELLDPIIADVIENFDNTKILCSLAEPAEIYGGDMTVPEAIVSMSPVFKCVYEYGDNIRTYELHYRGSAIYGNYEDNVEFWVNLPVKDGHIYALKDGNDLTTYPNGHIIAPFDFGGAYLERDSDIPANRLPDLRIELQLLVQGSLSSTTPVTDEFPVELDNSSNS